MGELTYADVTDAAARISGRVREVAVARVSSGGPSADQGELYLALEFIQHTGTFKARGAQNFLQAHRDAGMLPDIGVTIASAAMPGWHVPGPPGIRVCRQRCSCRRMHLQ